jgi:hypothetical protein
MTSHALVPSYSSLVTLSPSLLYPYHPPLLQNTLKVSQEDSVSKLLALGALLEKEKAASVEASTRCAQLSVMAQALNMTVSEKDALLKRYVPLSVLRYSSVGVLTMRMW